MGQSSLTLSATTAADLTAKRYYAAKETSAGLALCATLGERCDGVIGVGNTGAVSIERGPKVRIKAGAAFARGANLTPNASGKFVTASTGHHVAFIAAQAALADGDEVDAYTPLSYAPTLDVASVAAVNAPGAIPPTADYVQLSVDGTDAFTLDDGAIGHQITIECIAATNTPLGTVTLNGAQAAYGSERTAWTFFAVGQKLTLRMTSTGWKFVSKGKAGAQTCVLGTDALNPLAAVINLSITGTVSGALPAGDQVGEFVDLRVTTAASTPVGTVTFAGKAMDGTAHTQGVFNATTDYLLLGPWNGSAWLELPSSGNSVTLS